MRRRFSTLITVGLLFAACRALSPGPVDTVAAYTTALREARYADAWRMLSTSARGDLSLQDFESLARERPDELRATLTAYERVDTGAPLSARLQLRSGATVSMIWEDGAWRVDPAALVFYDQRTPQGALRAFVRAVESERWDVLVRLAPRSVAAQMRMASSQPADGGAAHRAEELLREAWSGTDEGDRQRLQLLGRALDSRGARVEITGDRARFVYGTADEYTARLLREDGLWRVEDTDEEGQRAGRTISQ